ncbi:hypothetical protein Tco_0584643, partial [Tanacetum coccineum]
MSNRRKEKLKYNLRLSIIQKLEANVELSKSMLGSELQGEDFAKRMVDLVNQRKKFFAALKSQRVVHADIQQATPAWTNTNRVNKA